MHKDHCFCFYQDILKGADPFKLIFTQLLRLHSIYVSCCIKRADHLWLKKVRGKMGKDAKQFLIMHKSPSKLNTKSKTSVCEGYF